MKQQPFANTVRNAWAGIRHVWRAERNWRTEVYLGAAALGVFAGVRPAPLWWALIVLCIAFVLAAELANSALEALIDHLHPERHAAIGQVKDMLAGMVLVASAGAVVVGLMALFDTLSA